jgi:hypothetical protein
MARGHGHGPPEGDEEAVTVSTLPVLCNSRFEVLLLGGVAVAREKAKGSEPVDDMTCCLLGLGDESKWIRAGNRLAKG